MEQLYFQDDEEIATYLGLTLEEFLRQRNDGRFSVSPSPRDPELVYWRCDIDRWIADGRPVSILGRGGT